MFRPISITGFWFLLLGSLAMGQIYSGSSQPIRTQPLQQQQLQQDPLKQQPDQMPPLQTPPIRQQTLQTPPKSIVHNGVTVYQNQPNPYGNPNPSNPQGFQGYVDPNQGRTMPPGFGSPYPTGTVRVASNDTDPDRQRGAVYGLPGQSQAAVQPLYTPSGTPQPQPVLGQAPVGNQVVPAGQPGQPMPNYQNPVLYQPNPAYQPTPTNQAVAGGQLGQPASAENSDRSRTLVGRSEPAQRIIPFFLKPEEKRELDEFLGRWEQYSSNIKRYDVDFTAYIYNPLILAPGDDPNKPQRVTFGMFKYIAPSRFVYHLEGEWINGKQVKASPEMPKIEEEKIIINEKTVYKYDSNSKTVFQFNLPPEMIGRGIADSPLPLIFGAKADEMKKRFSMKIETPEQNRETQVWLQAVPLQIEDQQEFLRIDIMLDKKTLRAIALKKYDINGKGHIVYVLKDPKINDGLDKLVDVFRNFFTPTVPSGWKHIVEDWKAPQVAQQVPAAVPSGTQPAIGNPALPRQEIPLYSPK